MKLFSTIERNTLTIDTKIHFENIVEKDSIGKIRVSMNIFKFDGNMFFNYLKNCPVTPNRNEKELPTALLNMVREHPMSTIGIPLSEHVPDLTSKEDILILKEYIKNISI